MQTIITLVDTTAGAYRDIAGIGRLIAGTPIVTTNLFFSDFRKMPALMRELADGTITVETEYDADELASGLLEDPNVLTPLAIKPRAAIPAAGAPATEDNQGLLFHVAYKVAATGASGTIIDTTLYAVNTIPAEWGDKFRVVMAWADVAVNLAADVISLRSRAAGAGTLLASVSANATGIAFMTGLGASNVSAVVTRGALEGLFARCDRSVTAELHMLISKEE